MDGIDIRDLLLGGFEQKSEVQDCAGTVCISLFVLLIVIIIIWGIFKWCKRSKSEIRESKTKEPFANTKKELNLYNPLYTSPEISQPGSFVYTQPMGDTDAAEYARNIQGTSGEFLPLQGRAAGVFMSNSSNNNLVLPTKNKGTIGGYPNLTEEVMTQAIDAGFNNFGAPLQGSDDKYSNSYLLDGANVRVCNSGQKCDNLEPQNWWPTVRKGPGGFALQASDSLVPCGGKLQDCSGSKRFLRSKFEPRWKSVFNKH